MATPRHTLEGQSGGTPTAQSPLPWDSLDERVFLAGLQTVSNISKQKGSQSDLFPLHHVLLAYLLPVPPRGKGSDAAATCGAVKLSGGGCGEEEEEEEEEEKEEEVLQRETEQNWVKRQ